MIELKVDYKEKTAMLSMMGDLETLVHDLQIINGAVIERLLANIDEPQEVERVANAISTIMQLEFTKKKAERRIQIKNGARIE